MEMNVIIQSTNNISLAGVMHLPPNQSEEKEKKIVVICHGFMSSKDVDRFVYYADEFSKKGYNALRFDFSGCGESDKALISVKQEVDDLLAIIYFCNERGFDEIALMGHSLGCLICLEAYPKAGRVRKRIKSMILLAPVTYSKNPGFVGDEDIEEVKKRGEIEVTNHRGFTAKISKKFLDERTHIDTKEIMKPIDINVQIMQGKRDKSIDPRKTEEAYKMLPKGSELVMFPQANHNFQGHKEKIMNKIFEWFEKAGF